MPRKTSRQLATYPPERLAGLRAASQEKKQATKDRLQTAIDALLSCKPPKAVTLANVAREGGPTWSTIKDNEKALELWEKHKPKRSGTARPRDPLLSYSRAELIAELRQQRTQAAGLREQLQVEQRTHAVTRSQYEAVLATELSKDEEIAQLQAKLARYDQHLSGLRDSLNRQEHE
jgi:hypothetical protein